MTKYVPRPFQHWMIDHAKENDASAELVDMGLGKTVAMLTVIAWRVKYLLSRGTLIIAPLKVVQDTWPKEMAKWDHTKHLRIASVYGGPKQREAALKKPADLYLINYENLIWLSDWLHDNDEWPFDAYVFDESSKMKAHNTKRFKLFKPHIRRFRYRNILTGTPAPNSYEDLWAQFYLLDEGKRLGQFFTHFADRFFVQTLYNGFPQRRIRKGAAKEIQKRISDISIVLRSEDHIKLPGFLVNDVEVVMPEKVRDAYEELEREMFVKIDQGDVEALNGAALTSKCRQFTSGAIYREQPLNEDGKPAAPRTWMTVHSAKLDALEDIIDANGGQPILIAYDFKHSASRLKERFKSIQFLGKDGKVIDAWNRGEVPLLAVHPASAGHGLNLQFGGHILVWFDLVYSLEQYQQLNKRLDRQGQKHPVIAHRLMVRRSIDQAVAGKLKGKDQSQRGLLAALQQYRASKQSPLLRNLRAV